MNPRNLVPHMNCATFPHQAPRTEGGREPAWPWPAMPQAVDQSPWMPRTKEVTKLILTCCLSEEVSHIRWTRKRVLKLARKQVDSALSSQGVRSGQRKPLPDPPSLLQLPSLLLSFCFSGLHPHLPLPPRISFHLALPLDLSSKFLQLICPSPPQSSSQHRQGQDERSGGVSRSRRCWRRAHRPRGTLPPCPRLTTHYRTEDLYLEPPTTVFPAERQK